jgi:hypothetical protein
VWTYGARHVWNGYDSTQDFLTGARISEESIGITRHTHNAPEILGAKLSVAPLNFSFTIQTPERWAFLDDILLENASEGNPSISEATVTR